LHLDNQEIVRSTRIVIGDGDKTVNVIAALMFHVFLIFMSFSAECHSVRSPAESIGNKRT
jgi:hypothetical protein